MALGLLPLRTDQQQVQEHEHHEEEDEDRIHLEPPSRLPRPPRAAPPKRPRGRRNRTSCGTKVSGGRQRSGVPAVRRRTARRSSASALKAASSPRSIAARAPAVRSSRKRTLCSERRTSPSSSCWFTRWRRYAREKPVQAPARAALVERRGVAGEAGVAEVEASLPGQRRPGPAEPRRQHAVEHVHPALDHLEDARRVADPHEVARPVGRQERRGPARPCRAWPRGPPPRSGRRARARRSRAPRSPRSSAGGARDRCLPARSRRGAAPRRGGPRAGARAQRVVRSAASASSSREASAGRQMSRHMATSEPSRRWIAAASSGVKRASSPVVDGAERDALVVGRGRSCPAARRPGSRPSP